MAILSVIVPVYNEAGTIKQILDKINSVNIDKEVIVVDDSSSDDTDKILRGLQYENLKVIHHSSNRGKGASVLTGLSQASGEYVVVQDADLEYDPNDYLKLMDAMKNEGADIVLGARFTSDYNGSLIPKFGNRLLTKLVNILFGFQLNDCFTCYKLMRRAPMVDLSLESKSFDIEIEIIAKAIRRRMRIIEVPILYSPRSYEEGKKIRIKDGIWAMIKIFWFRFG